MYFVRKIIIKPFISAFFSALLFPILLYPTQLNADTPDVLVTLKPLHSLVSALMLDIGEPGLLLDNLQSPHDYSMKPSDRRRINQADIIIYASADIESFIPAIQNSLPQQKFIKLTNIPGLKLLETRAFDSHAQQHNHHIDGHIWLSIDNAIIISQYLSNEFIKQDPLNSERYRTNSNKQISKLRQLKKDIQQQVLPLRNQAFLMFHDAFQYFENEFQLSSGMFVTTSPDHKPGIRHILKLKQKIQQQNIRCIFYEPPHIPKIIQTLTEGSKIQLIPLEPLGIKYEMGNEQYFKLLSDISYNLYNCLKQDL